MRIFGKAGLYIKNTGVIEKMSHISAVVFDKTGTITQPNETKISYSGETLSKEEMDAVFSISKQSTHPLSHSISSSYRHLNYQSPEHFVEVAGRGIFGKASNYNIKIGSEEYVCNKKSESTRESSVVFVSVNEKVKGFYTISNQYREGFGEVLKTLKSKFKIFLISGDNDAEAKNLTGFFENDKMFFNQKPADKAGFIKELQEKGETILMTGDGLNDAGALMQSDVALTVADKVYHFSPASDAVLEAAQFQRLAKFIRFTKTSLNIVKLSFTLSFFYNIIGISIALTGNLSPVIAAILMPVSSVSVVAFATFATRFMGRIKL
jgi:Cu+-exporting ATPase